MKGQRLLYALDKPEVLKRFRKAINCGIDGITEDDLRTVDAGTPVRVVVLRKAFTAQELRMAFHSAEPDPIAEEQQAPKRRVPETITVVRMRRSEPGERIFGVGLMKSEPVTFRLSRTDVRDRLMTALKSGDRRITAGDLIKLDSGTLEERALALVFSPDELARADVRSIGRHREALAAAGIELEAAIDKMRRGGRR
jgi:hypothetical protein